MIGDKHRVLRTQKRGSSLGGRAEKAAQMKCLVPPGVRKVTKGAACGETWRGKLPWRIREPGGHPDR